MSIGLEIAIILMLVLLNGVLAMSEMAIVSSRKARLQQQADEGKTGARVALELANEPSHFLSALQIGITLISILAGVFSGATLAEKLADGLGLVPWLTPYRTPLAMGMIVLGIGYLTLVVGELAPKRLALNHAERVAAFVARPMRWFTHVCSPAVRLLSFSTELLLHLLGVRAVPQPPITEEEIKIMVEQAAQAGEVEVVEQQMVENVFRFGDLRVDQLMTPRPKIVSVDMQDPPELNWRKMIVSGHSYFPAYRASPDTILGMASVKLLWARTVAGQPLDWNASLLKPLLVPESMKALKLLELFKQSRMHIALVVDEYGIIQGLVTIIDVLEAIVGDVPSHEEAPEQLVVQRADGSWLIDGTLPVDDFKDHFQLPHLPGEETAEYQTLGGFLIMQMGRIPTEGDRFDWESLRFEIMDMDGHRVDKILVLPRPRDARGEPGA